MSLVLMRIADHASGIVPREGYRDWFRVEQIALPTEPPGHRRSGGSLSNRYDFRVWRKQDAMTSRLQGYHANSRAIRFILVEFEGGSQPPNRLRFDQVFVQEHQVASESSPLEWVVFAATSWAVT